MSLLMNKFNFLLVFLLNNPWSIECRCGYPELPFMAGSIESKDYYEEGEELKVHCLGGIVVTEGSLTDPKYDVIKCMDNKWDKAGLRCAQLHNFTSMDILMKESKDQITTEMQNKEFALLSDENAMTCVTLKDDERWSLHLNEYKYVTHVSLLVTFIDGNNDRMTMNMTVKAGSDECLLDQNTTGPHNPIALIVYKCPLTTKSDNVSIILKANGHDISICTIDIFAINDNRCGKPEVPLYGMTNQIEIQNGTQVVEYMCTSGYVLNGTATKMCGNDGVWTPQVTPKCIPEVRCEFLTSMAVNYTVDYIGLDLFGVALPGSKAQYRCTNRSIETSDKVARTCLDDGKWSTLIRYPDCHHKHIVIFGRHIPRDPHLVVYGGSALCLLFVGSAIILFHMRRLAKKISRQMRENSYKQQSKILPNYNSEANYNDITVWAADNPQATETPYDPNVGSKF